MHPTAREYLEHALDIIQTNWVHRQRMIWAEFRAATLAEAAEAQTTDDVHPALRNALTRLGDGHSCFLSGTEIQKSQAIPESLAIGRSLEGAAYVSVPHFNNGAGITPQQFGAELQKLIQSLDQPGSLGWIIDLRNNGGGNMWPMMAGLGPLLGSSPIGFFTSDSWPPVPWWYRLGTSGSGDGEAWAIEIQPYHVRNAELRVAVLTGAVTASSGEAVCIAFRGMPNVRSLGQPTFGVPTGNSSFAFSDGAVLYLTTCLMADRTGQSYDGPIPPDVFVEPGPGQGADDPVIAAALDWLRQG